MASLLCVRALYTMSEALLTKTYKLRKALRPTITKHLPIFHSRLLDFIPLRHLRSQRLIKIHIPGLHSPTFNPNLASISTLPRPNISVPHPSVPPLPWTRHTPVQWHGQNVPRFIHMYGDHGRRSQ